jgi:predicted nucleic acid-binding protein
MDVDRRIARHAAELRARYRRLRPADSLQVATALEAGAGFLLTNDRGLGIVPELRVLLVDDFRSTA